jgi:TatD DNase family protein
MYMKLIDSHCHLDKLEINSGLNCETTIHGSELSETDRTCTKPKSLEEALTTARLRGVAGFLCIAIDLENFEAVKAIAESSTDIWCSAGIHPLANMNASDLQEADLCAKVLSHPKVIAVGECGLDYHYQKDQRDNQLALFEKQLRVAVEVGKPVVVHTREAREDTMNLLEKYTDKGLTGVLHCFTESLAMAMTAVDLGLYISFSGIITFANAAPLRKVVEAVPLDRILVETDSPYLAPVPYRGKSNLPQWVVEVAKTVAVVKNCSLEEVAQVTTDNFTRLFKLTEACRSWDNK